ncbi:restriction endonuclease subunit S [Streptosporangium pseudovulgare]|uniref:Restriction endonuclease subunit S n=1 Tax=Streptosporangium pseudovulgare TaxID=35765 RepID=A0ABQ2R177_9ACTN|nr:restriction endonuclease subunit S [Streptosporangium pseudovulgare]GGQ07406.1 restriction endonuclease subunit S [Streptosporangium pseudovulgare]
MSGADLAPWLARSKWPTVPIRYVAKLGTGHTPSRQHPEYWEDCTIPWITLADVWQLRDGTRDTVVETKEKISRLGLANSAAVLHPAGTVILSRTASVGFSAIMGQDMATSQDFATWICGPKIEPRYLLHALRAMAPDLRRVAAGSTHKTIYMPDIEQLRIPLPSVEEQRRIVDFLGVEIPRIQRILSARRRQIDLIEERCLARAFDAIRGFEYAGDRVDSGLSWLGDIPKSWPVMAVSSQFDVQLGKMLNQDRVRGSHLKPYLRVANVQWDEIETDDLLLMDFPLSERRRYEVLPGDLLICEGGSYPGRAAVWDGRIPEIYYQKALHRARSYGRSSVRWLYYCLRVARSMSVFEVEGNATTMTHLTGDQLAAHRFPFPDRSVQDEILEGLEISVEKDKRLVRALEHQLHLIDERKQSLITAAVTGQVDVTAS